MVIINLYFLFLFLGWLDHGASKGNQLKYCIIKSLKTTISVKIQKLFIMVKVPKGIVSWNAIKLKFCDRIDCSYLIIKG